MGRLSALTKNIDTVLSIWFCLVVSQQVNPFGRVLRGLNPFGRVLRGLNIHLIE